MKKLIWAVIIIALIIYSIVVWSWIEEGNREFEQGRRENAESL